MKILETEKGWAVEHNGTIPVKLDGEGYFQDKAVLTAAVEKRGMYIWADGSVEKVPEARKPRKPEPKKTEAQKDEEWEAAAPIKDSSGAPPSEDPPTDPNAQPDDPDPNPTSPEPVVAPPKKSAEKKPRKKTAKKPAEPAKRGRPRIYSEEEAAERRRAQARQYAANRSEEQKAAARERAKRWRENNPDKVKSARQKSMEARAERYETDADYRAQFNEYQREYKRKQRGSKD